MGAIEATPAPGDWLSAREARVLAGFFLPARRASWLAGRWLAKKVVTQALGVPVAACDIEILAAADGAPDVLVAGRPLGRSLSLTHRAGWAAAALALDDARSIGVDLELVEPRSPAFVRDYLTAPEQRFVAAHTDPALAANLVWSAKESALKALRTGLRRDTLSLDVTPAEARLAVADREHGHVLHGQWGIEGPMVMTLVARPRAGASRRG